MSTVKSTFEKMVQQQKEMTEKLSGNAGKMMDLYSMDTEMVEKGKQLMADYLEEQKNIMEASLKPENMGIGFPAFYMKAMNTQLTHFQKTTDFAQRYWKNVFDTYQETIFPKTKELVEENVKTVTETAKASSELVKDLVEN